MPQTVPLAIQGDARLLEFRMGDWQGCGVGVQ